MGGDEARAACGWMKLFTAQGVLVTLPVGVPFDYAGALAGVAAALGAGWLVNMPGLEAGEEKEEIGYVLRREKVNSDRSETPVLDLYSSNDAAKFKTFSVYLNKPEDVAAFEAASGLKLASLRVFPGTAAPERGANKSSDAFIVRAPRPFGVVLKPNPKFNPDETDATKKKPKRLFVRWAGAPAGPAPVTESNKPGPATPADLVAEYRFVHDEAGFARLEAIRERLWPTATGAGDRTRMKEASDECRRRLTGGAEAQPAGSSDYIPF